MEKNNKNKKLDFVFFGTPDIAVDTLEALKQNGLIPSLIVTAPDRPQGRKMLLTPPPVKIWAEKNKIQFLQPEALNRDSLYSLLTTNYSLFIVVAYGKIFPEWLINLPKYDTLNVHYSLLPKYRGAAPVQVAILTGDTKTGVTIQKMVYELDAGPIIAQKKVKISPNEKAPELFKKLLDGMEADDSIGIGGAACIIPDSASWFQKKAMRQIPRRVFPVQECNVDSDMVQHPCLVMPRELFLEIKGEREQDV